MIEQREAATGIDRQRADAARNWAEILAAAARTKRGAGLNMRAIAVAAGVSRSTLYRLPSGASAVNRCYPRLREKKTNHMPR
jgi:hypothetical protein